MTAPIIQTIKRSAIKIVQQLTVTVNGKVVTLPAGATILDALKAAGTTVPTLCYHPRFKSTATCRMCLVKVEDESYAVNTSKRPAPERKPHLLPACRTPLAKGMVITTDTEELKQFRTHNLNFILSRHPNDCLHCEASGQCKLQDLVKAYQVEESWPKTDRGSLDHPEHLLHDHSSPAIHRDMDKCIECGLCVQACAEQGINAIGFAERGTGRIPVTVFDQPLSETNCINCGQCVLHCPVGALTERPDWQRVNEVLDSKRRITCVQVAPATRVAIGEEFGFDPGTVSTGRLINALRECGFDKVFDVNFSADLTIMEEANELLARVRDEVPNAKLPLFTSCCPAWINYVETQRPDLIPHLSTAKSPQQMLGPVIKYGPFGKSLVADEEPFVVSIMPCTAKKDEADRPAMRDDVDAVLTTRELARLIRHRGINFASLSNTGTFDSPLGESTGAAVIFGASGGVLEAALRTAAHELGIDAPLEWNELRGVDGKVKVAKVPGVGSVAAVNSIGAAVELLSNDNWKKDYLMIEVMTCKGGCLGGGGEPKSDDPDILQKRMKAIYSIDSASEKRMSHENEEVQQLYTEFFEHPLSATAEKYLHATYAARRSPRDKLMKFLDAVDHRDGMVAAHLFDEDGVWHTNVPLYGSIQGRHAISDFIKIKLPPITATLLPGVDRIRHKMMDHMEGTDVASPLGDMNHFDVVLNEETGLIRSLTRIPLETDRLETFLDAVDRRDGEAAAKLFTESGEWHINMHSYGDLLGRDQIRDFIEQVLPPLVSSSGVLPRHELLSITDATVRTPVGDTVHFQVDLDSHSGLIRSLTRLPMSDTV